MLYIDNLRRLVERNKLSMLYEAKSLIPYNGNSGLNICNLHAMEVYCLLDETLNRGPEWVALRLRPASIGRRRILSNQNQTKKNI